MRGSQGLAVGKAAKEVGGLPACSWLLNRLPCAAGDHCPAGTRLAVLLGLHEGGDLLSCPLAHLLSRGILLVRIRRLKRGSCSRFRSCTGRCTSAGLSESGCGRLQSSPGAASGGLPGTVGEEAKRALRSESVGLQTR